MRVVYDRRMRRLLFVLLMAACNVPNEPPRQSARSEPVHLSGTEWQLATMNGEPVLDGTRITLTFDEKSGGGYSGCNWYGGQYAMTGNKLQFKDITSSARGCLQPEGIEKQERTFIELLKTPLEPVAEQQGLMLKDATGKTVLEFSAIASLGMDPAALRGTRWQLPESNVTLTFEDDKNFRGFGGCRDYRGTYSAKGDRIHFDSITMTATECDQPLDVQRAEEELTTDLSEAERYQLSTGHFDLMTVRGTHRVFVPLTMPAAISGAPQLQPVDEAAKDPSFVAFRTSLLAALEKRDKNALLALIARDIRTDFGGGGGRRAFITHWKLNEELSPVWEQLPPVVRLGGKFTGARTFWAPYVYSAWPEDVDSFEHVAAVRDDVIVRDGVNPIARLDHHIVRIAQDDPVRGGNRSASRRKVVLPDKREGWVAADEVRSPVDYRAAFDKRNGVWRMTALVAGD